MLAQCVLSPLLCALLQISFEPDTPGGICKVNWGSESCKAQTRFFCLLAQKEFAELYTVQTFCTVNITMNVTFSCICRNIKSKH